MNMTLIKLSEEKITNGGLDQSTIDSARAFTDAFNKGTGLFLQAARIVAEAVAKNPKFPDVVDELTDGRCPAVLVRRFARLGRGEIYHGFMHYWENPGVRKLIHLPFSVQELCAKERIKLLVDKGDTLLVDPTKMTKAQEDQVFTKEGDIRTLEEQRIWIEDKNRKFLEKELLRNATKVESIYTFSNSNKTIVFNGSCRFDVDELMKILVNRK
jgi:hypothetical protein